MAEWWALWHTSLGVMVDLVFMTHKLPTHPDQEKQ